jgi:hypothetical protein
MNERTGVGGRCRTGAVWVDSTCAACGGNVRLHVPNRTTYGPQGSAGAITYADTDVAVWDCPTCGFANADDLHE